MGSRLRPVPEKIFECLIEVAAPLSENEGVKLLSIFPENYEELESIKGAVPDFCFPFAHDAEMVDAVQHFAFVLTDIEGLFRFGFCRYPPKARTCLCILSDLPAFEMFYGILNTLAELENNARNECITSKQFLDLVLESNIPEPGTKFTVSDPGSGWIRQYNYPDPEKLPSIPENRNLTDYFSAVNPNNMIALFASMMFERRIIITSKKLSLLTACTYSASLLLNPMHWQHIFIPVMPPSILDYCSAPMPFLFGVHSSLMEKVRDMPLDDVVILDVDRNEIEVGCDDVDELPSEAVSKLNNALKKNTIAVGDYVARAFLSAIVVLIGGYRDALKLSNDKIVFDEDVFVNSRPHMKSFLEQILKLQIFERFIHHRLEQLNSGDPIDDVFEEQVGLQTESDSKWVSQYKQWMKNRKRDGTQLLNKFSGKTEKATYKAKKFIHAGVKNVKLHGKSGLKEAVRGIREKSKNFIENSKGSEKEIPCYDNMSGPSRSNSLPLSRVNDVKPNPNMQARRSIGYALHNHVSPPPSPTKSPRPSRPPPCVPTNASPNNPPPRPPPPTNPPPKRPTPPSLPPPYQPPATTGSNSPTPESEIAESPPVNGSNQSRPRKGSTSLKLRPSMLRNPGEPGVQDLIHFYDSQEDVTSSNSRSNDPFAEFEEFDYLNATAKSQTELKRNELSSSAANVRGGDGFFDQTMIALSDDTRQFLRNSRLLRESSENSRKSENFNQSLNNESPRLQRKPPVKRIPGKKTLREIALEQKTGNGHIPLAHSSSAPSLVDLLSDNMEKLHHSNSSSDITSSSGVTSSSGTTSSVSFVQSSNVGQVGFENLRTDNGDPFLDLISQRHNPQGKAVTGQQNGAAWVATFD